MARGLPTSCSTVTHCGSRSSSSSVQTARTLTSKSNIQHLDRNIEQAIQLRSGRPVKAFVVLALHDNGEIVTHTTDHVQQCTDGIFADDAKERLRIAHEKSMLRASHDRGSNVYDRSPTSTLGDSSPNGICYGNESVRGPTARIDGESHHASRPTSARTFGSASDWPSDEECPRRSRGQSGAELHIAGLSNQTRPTQMQFLLVCEASKIEELVAKNLRTMQQLAVKIIAKAWIKGICPRKQALFPYCKKKRDTERNKRTFGPAPGWWPDESVCKFVEPDHIKRDERVSLCLHLLRLRPTPEKLKEWNNGSVEPHQTHVTKGWTEFLKELAPPSGFDEMREPDGKNEERKKLLAQIYDIAKREEDYKNGEIDGDDRFWWSNEPVKPTSKKKARRSHDDSNDDSDMESFTNSGPPSKRSKRTSLATTPAGSPSAILPQETESDDAGQDCKPQVNMERLSDVGTLVGSYRRSGSAQSSQGPWIQEQDCLACDSKDIGLSRPMHEHVQVSQSASLYPHLYPISTSWADTSSSTAFQAPVTSSCQPLSQGFSIEAPNSTFPGQHNYQFPQHNSGVTSNNMRYSPYVAHQLSQPQIETLSVSGSDTPPVHSQPTYMGQGHYNDNAIYYSQPGNSPSELFSAPSTPNMNLQFTYTAPPNVPLQHCTTSQAPGFVIDPSSYQHHPEVGHQSYPPSAPHYSAFQAPARVERGFTGHASGVGGGAHT